MLPSISIEKCADIRKQIVQGLEACSKTAYLSTQGSLNQRNARAFMAIAFNVRRTFEQSIDDCEANKSLVLTGQENQAISKCDSSFFFTDVINIVSYDICTCRKMHCSIMITYIQVI